MKALILAGGRSKRMGRDKALISRPDKTRQIDHLISLIRPFANDIVISTNDPTRLPDGFPTLADQNPGGGPLGALATWFAHSPGTTLVVGCDLFLLDRETLQHLIKHRNPDAPASCFQNRIDGKPEPLCAIYSGDALAEASTAVAEGRLCARQFIESLDPQLLELPNPVALDNANSLPDLDEAFAKLRHGVTPKSVHVLYFAKLRESRGLDEERIDTLACTAAGLYEELRFRHRLPFRLDSLRCARNNDFCEWNTLIEDGDEIVFIPPVAGG